MLAAKRPNAFARSIPAVRTKKRIEIAIDEWNIVYRNDLFRPDGRPPLEERYHLKDALWVASVLNMFQRMGDRVTLANIATLLNSIGTIFTSPNGMFLQTIYFPLKLYSHEAGNRALRSDGKGPTFSSKSFTEVPLLDVSATFDEIRRTPSVAVVNRHECEPIHTSFEVYNARLAPQATVFEINGTSPDIQNSFSEPDNVQIAPKQIGAIANRFGYTFPTHSVSLLKLSFA